MQAKCLFFALPGPTCRQALPPGAPETPPAGGGAGPPSRFHHNSFSTMEVRAPPQNAMAVAPAPSKYFAYQMRMPPTPHNPTGRPLAEFPGCCELIFYASYCRSCAIADVSEEVEPGSWCCAYLSSECGCQPCVFVDRRNKLAAKYGITIPYVPQFFSPVWRAVPPQSPHPLPLTCPCSLPSPPTFHAPAVRMTPTGLARTSYAASACASAGMGTSLTQSCSRWRRSRWRRVRWRGQQSRGYLLRGPMRHYRGAPPPTEGQ